MTELTMEAGWVSDTERPVWDYTNDLKRRTTLHLEPSFKDELGLVFLQLKRGEEEMGIWLDAERVASLREGLSKIAEYASDKSWDE